MNRFMKSAILSVAVAATTLTALPAANAGDWHNRRHYHSRNSDLAVAGIVGLAAGALAVGLASREPVYSERVYVAPRPRPYRDYPVVVEREPEVVYVDDYAAAMEPWSPEWYQYCSDRYRSFNPRNGTFTGYDGLKHFCVAN